MMRAVVALAAVAWSAAAVVLVSGGLSFRIAGVLVRAHSPVPAFIVAGVLTVVAAAAGRGAVRAALSWWWDAIERRGAYAAAGLAVAAVVIGVQWGTFVAGGSDSYCYLNQAELFARGVVHDYEPFGADPQWPGTPGAFVPAGHSPVPSRPGAMAPICPAGYPIMLAGARLAFGRQAMFWVTPLMGGLAVWLTLLLGRSVGRILEPGDPQSVGQVFRPGDPQSAGRVVRPGTDGGAVGLLAALLLVTSPIFIYQLVQPMNDVPATALWCAALVVASRAGMRPLHRAVSAGLLAGGALTIRPNLLPLAAVIGLWMWRDPRPSLRQLVAFTAALAPGVLFVLVAQDAIYGSPFRSGYGDLSSLFSREHVLPNLARYPRWLLDVHSPLLLLALAAPLFARGEGRRTSLWLLAFCAAVLACYLPYVVFDDWWYQRFVLPSVPPLLVLTALAVGRLLTHMQPAARAAVFALVCATCAIMYLNTAAKRDAFRLRDYEHRFRAAGEQVAMLPANAVIITGHQTGSVRYYSGRSTAGWGDIPPGRLADAIAYLRRQGRTPYLLFESWEEPHFRTRFAQDPLGSLAWPPAIEIDRTVRIYDPDDYPNYMRGAFVPTQRVVTRRR